MTDICEKCGKEIRVGEWAWCPHGFPERAGGVAVIDDQLPGGPQMLENLSHEPVYVETKSQLRAEMHARGLRQHVRHVGEKGSDKSKNTTRWI